jgi:hypothetical protein
MNGPKKPVPKEPAGSLGFLALFLVLDDQDFPRLIVKTHCPEYGGHLFVGLAGSWIFLPE